MHPARIADLLHPFFGAQPANESLCQHISTYVDILLRWNARINLTAIRNPEEIVTRHFGESLFAARHLFPNPARKGSSEKNYPVSSVVKDFDSSAADLGSGAGFPGIPIKLWAPHLTLTLIESNQKKTAFLREIIRALTLTNVNVFPGRAEQLLQEQPAPGRFDLVTLRAVERFAAVLPVAASLISPGGRLALLVGSSQLAQAQATLPTFTWDPPLAVPESQSRTLLIAHKS